MPGPWDKYASAPASAAKPWEKYGPAVAQETPAPAVVPAPVSKAGNAFASDHPLDTLAANVKDAGPRLMDLVKGVGKGALGTIGGADDWATRHLPSFMTTPIGQSPNADNSARATAYTKALATPHNAEQSFGKGVEQAAEFLAPGGAEEKASAKLLGMIPGAGKMAKAGVRALAAGIGSGAVNDLQGGSFTGGAATGFGGSMVGSGLKALAPIVAEKAIGVRAIDRAYNRTPGQAILDETTGVRPGTIADQAQSKVAGYSSKLDDNAMQSNLPVDLQPARSTAASFQKTANLQNNEDEIRDIATISKQLMDRAGTPIPNTVSAHEGLALKRGLGSLADYNPAMTQGLGDTAVKGTIASMQPELAAAIPGYESLNSKISTLLPAAKRAGATDLNESLMARVLTRVGAKTGALAGAGIGTAAGYKEGGVGGAVAGGLTGLFAPELLTNPTTLMALARGGYNPATQKLIIPAIGGAAMQFGRPKSKESRNK